MFKLIIKILIIIIGLFLLLGYFFSETQTNKYSNIFEVQKDNAIVRGWIPSVLPESAYDIKETHNLDTNYVVGEFKYKEIDETVLVKKLMRFKKDTSIMIWDDFFFSIDKEKNYVKFYNTEYKKIHGVKNNEF